MKQIKTKDKKYPLKIVLEDGTKITVPKQKNFSNAFLRKHGCSLMAEYVALHPGSDHYIRHHRYLLSVRNQVL